MRLAFLLLVAQVRESTAARCVAAALRWRLNVLHLHVHDVGVGLHHTVAHMQSGLEANLCFLDGNHCLLQTHSRVFHLYFALQVAGVVLRLAD